MVPCGEQKSSLGQISDELNLGTSDHWQLPPIGGIGAGTNFLKYPVLDYDDWDYTKNSHFEQWMKTGIV